MCALPFAYGRYGKEYPFDMDFSIAKSFTNTYCIVNLVPNLSYDGFKI
jgi:hypothetical protein